MTLVGMLFVLSLVFWAGLMVYSWATTYPMFRDIPAEGFIEVHRTYERGLPVGVYLPFGIMGFSVAAAIFVRPPEIPVPALWIGAIALAGGVITTAFCAAPMHIALIKHGKDLERIRRMLACNAARAAFAVVGLGGALWTLAMI